MTFYFFSSRLLDTDFRKPLINALIAKGHNVWHVRIGRLNILTRPNDKPTEFRGMFGLLTLIHLIDANSRACKSRSVFVDTTGACVPIRSLFLRASLRGVWCFDIFDDLLYELRGLYRLKRWLGISLLVRFSPIRIVLSHETLRLYPNAYHLDNAAHTRRVSRIDSNFSDLVTLFWIDNRFDFGLVKEVAALAPQMKTYLYGRYDTEDQSLKLRLEKLCANHPNVIYRGEYRFDDVDAILAPFGIGFMPYITNNFLTEFINPDKYYLYLNSGMEVISTDIPQARRMRDSIHIAYSAGEVIELAARIRSDHAYRKNNCPGHAFSWHQRADEFIKIIESQVISRRFGSSKSSQSISE